MVRILVTGGDGQLGTALRRIRWPEGHEAVALGRAAFDLADAAAIAARVVDGGFAAVINAAAYTAVDRAEEEVAAAWAVNALAPAALGEACRRADIPLVQISTDYVFNGDKAGAWEPDDAVGPLGVYGASKLGGELAVRTSGARHAIVRTSWVVSAHGHNFVKTMLRVGAERGHLRVVDDQHGAPTSAADLAAALQRITLRLIEDRAAPSGTWHFSNAGTTTWCGFARAIFERAAARGGPSPSVEAIATADYPTPAKRPHHSVLSHATLTRDFGIEPRPWQAALDDILDELIGART